MSVYLFTQCQIHLRLQHCYLFTSPVSHSCSFTFSHQHFNYFQIPTGCNELHHEVELGIVIGSECKNVSENLVMGKIAGKNLSHVATQIIILF